MKKGINTTLEVASIIGGGNCAGRVDIDGNCTGRVDIDGKRTGRACLIWHVPRHSPLRGRPSLVKHYKASML